MSGGSLATTSTTGIFSPADSVVETELLLVPDVEGGVAGACKRRLAKTGGTTSLPGRGPVGAAPELVASSRGGRGGPPPEPPAYLGLMMLRLASDDMGQRVDAVDGRFGTGNAPALVLLGKATVGLESTAREGGVGGVFPEGVGGRGRSGGGGGCVRGSGGSGVFGYDRAGGDGVARGGGSGRDGPPAGGAGGAPRGIAGGRREAGLLIFFYPSRLPPSRQTSWSCVPFLLFK